MTFEQHRIKKYKKHSAKNTISLNFYDSVNNEESKVIAILQDIDSLQKTYIWKYITEFLNEFGVLRGVTE